jgi:hypothetical protein
MPTAGSGQRRKMIRDKLAQYAGSTPDAPAIAAATVAIWPRISAQLAPVIGARGVDVLLDRSLHLTSVSFPWLSSGADPGCTPVLEGIETSLARQEAAAAAAASCELLSAFCELLATLIGDSLTDRLLGPVWALAGAVPRQESGS